jgi:hydroxymethylbilane synthase
VKLRVKIGSRGSALARWQAEYVAERLNKIDIETSIEIIKTTGDHLQAASLSKIGGKGLFTKEIEEALLAGTIDLAVHSLKDLPTESPMGLVIAAIPEREDSRDALVGHTLASLPAGATVGTSSLRRAAQLLSLRPDVHVSPIRGNVDTRLRKLRDGRYSAILLAAAGLRRLGLAHEITEVLEPDQICCAPGQGALAIQTRETGPAREVCSELNHLPSEQAVICERSLLARVGGGCQLPVGAYAVVDGAQLKLTAVVASPTGDDVLRGSGKGDSNSPTELGEAVAEDLLARGASQILENLASAERR